MATTNQITPPTNTTTALAHRPKNFQHQHRKPLNQVVNWVPPPSPSEDGYELRIDTEGRWVIYRWKHGRRSQGGQPRIEPFFKRWPPSRTAAETCAWICVDRGRGRRIKGDDSSSNTAADSEVVGGGGLDGLQREFRELVKAPASGASETTEPPKVTPEQIDVLARKYNVLSGKWMIHSRSGQIDPLWRRVVGTVCFDRGKGRVKVSTREDGDDSHVIYVYVDDYTNREEVDALREALRMQAGVWWKIGFKPDVYTVLGIYKGNQWGLRPSRYHDWDQESGKK